MYRTIVVPLDGSALAERALPFARALAIPAETRIILVRAVPAPLTTPATSGPGAERLLAEAEAYLLTSFALLPPADAVPVAPVARLGEPAPTILDEARQRQGDLIVLSSHGRSGPGRLVFGSVSDAVVRHAEVPVLVVPARGERLWAKRTGARILVPLDGSERSEAALAPAVALADALGSGISLLRVVPPAEYVRVGDYPDAPTFPLTVDDRGAADDYLADLAQRLRRANRSVTYTAESGDPVAAILAVAEEEQVEAIAMASHGRGGLARLVLGSVSSGVTRASQVPVLIVRTAGGRIATKSGAPVAGR